MDLDQIQDFHIQGQTKRLFYKKGQLHLIMRQK